MKYYFITYCWTNRDGNLILENECIDRYPLGWLVSIQKEDYEDGSKHGYKLIGWQEIGEVEFLEFSENFE